jgi:CheY-like chemotaxis protein
MANILVVDDAPDSAVALCEYLRRAGGHTVTCVANGREALASVIQNPPDVVLLDLMMPEMDGPSFLEVVRSYLRLQSLPVVVWTALTESPMVDRARHLKVNAILAKAKATFEEVRDALEQAVHHLPG